MKMTLPSLVTPVSKWCVAVLLLLFCIGAIHSQTSQKHYTAEQSFVVKLGTTRPLHEIARATPTDSLKRAEYKKNKPSFVPNFAGRRHPITHNPNALPQGVDPLFNPLANRSIPTEILPIVNVEGLSSSDAGSGVPDVSGDIGKDYYVEIVNQTYFRVYDKTGTPVSGVMSANSIWSQVQQSSFGDPIILYDQTVDRWLLTEFPSNNRVLVAISHTGDPLGSWDAYSFQTPRFPDFPKYGIWGDAYYLTANESGGNFPIYAINRDDMLAGEDNVRLQRLTTPKVGGVFFEVGQPIDWDGMTPPPAGSPGIVVKLNDDDWGQTNTDQILFHKISIDWDNSNNSNIEILSFPTAPYDTDGCQLENTGGFSCIPQPNGQGIDGAEWIITNKAPYRNFGTHESFVISFMVDVTGDDVAGIRWMEFRKTATEDWHIYQEGTIGSDDGIHRFQSSISIDGQGNIGLGYAVSGPNKFPSLRFTGRYATDPLGEMTFIEHEFATGKKSQGFDRYGDYFTMSVDPTDDATFWFAGQYLPLGKDWGTRIVAFKATRDTFDVFPTTLIAPINDELLGSQEVEFTVLNRGLETVYSVPLGYQFNNGNWVNEDPGIDSLPMDQEFTFKFTTPFAIDKPGSYPIRIATFLDNDDNNKNDTLSYVITKYGIRDVALQYIVPVHEGLICNDVSDISIRLINVGIDTIKNIVFELSVFDVPVDTIEWNGSLAFGEETIFSFPAMIAEGPNDYSIDIDSLNTSYLDELPANNQINWTVIGHPEGSPVTLEFTTDKYPAESSWKLFDAAGNQIAAAGPFMDAQKTTTTEFCLDLEACYTFTVYDALGDGMSSQGVIGDYEIFNEQGELIADLAKPNFGDESSSQFCLTGECLFSLQVGVEQESNPGEGDAVAMAETINSLGSVKYSLDGGMTFQESSMFSNLSYGVYTLIAIDDAGCSDTTNFEILVCQLTAQITTQPASGGDVGEIHIYVTGNNGPTSYSIQEGEFISDSFFIMLEPGDYIVMVKDSAGCILTDTITVSTMVGTATYSGEYHIQISPNPGRDLFQIQAAFTIEDLFIPYTIHTSMGQAVSNGTIVQYNDKHKGEFSLKNFSSGTYYIVFHLANEIVVRRIIKVE